MTVSHSTELHIAQFRVNKKYDKHGEGGKIWVCLFLGGPPEYVVFLLASF